MADKDYKMTKYHRKMADLSTIAEMAEFTIAKKKEMTEQCNKNG
jgi:hypothetical protein